MKVFISPSINGPDRADGGIRRVIEAMVKYLPEFGIHVADNPNEADLINNHGAMLTEVPGVPMVSSCHGLYWDGYNWDGWAYDTNKRVIESLCRAQAVTAPSNWVNYALTRGMLVHPQTIYHGVDIDEWAHNEEPLGYVLWNKARMDPVSNPHDMNRVAAMLPRIPFLSTFGEPTPNVRVVGSSVYGHMRPVVQRAGVYLATTRETFGIGTLEALASGVPVVGWRYGGQEEIIVQGETGYLVEYGDYAALADVIQLALSERERLSANARDDARVRWGWKDKIAQYAHLFKQVAERWTMPGPKVSVIVTCHNLARYLPDALRSVEQQTMRDHECILVDDESADETAQIGEQWQSVGTGRTYLRTPRNLGLSGARNYGFYHARGKYIIYLDADDLLTPNALDTLSHALDHNTAIHIAGGRLDVMNDRGEERRKNPWPFHSFNWRDQMTHLNQITYSSMMRREVLERSGGYRTRDWRAEDAAFWCRVTSLGFRAQIVTEDSTLVYRMRGDSKTIQEHNQHPDKDGDWTAWYPWRVGAKSGEEGVDLQKRKAKPNPRLVPWSAQDDPPPPLKAWPVRHHQHPAVSVIIPVGPGHAQYLTDALDSLVAQTFQEWEVIVVNDGPKPLAITSQPFAQVINSIVPLYDENASYASLGAGAARNTGIQHARAPLCLFLDADDILAPTAIEKMVNAYVQSGGKYVYCDCATTNDPKRLDGPMEIMPAADYDQHLWVASGYEEGMPGRHSVTALVPTEHLRAVGGFDEEMRYWEDWDLYVKLAVAGVCGVRVPEPLLIYRLHTGQRRRNALAQEGQLRTALRGRYEAYARGEKRMGACCGGNAAALKLANTALQDILPPELTSEMPIFSLSLDDGPRIVRLEYIGEQQGAQSYIGPGTKRVYRLGRNPTDRYVDIPLAGPNEEKDIDFLVSGLQICRVVVQPPPPKDPDPEPIGQVLETVPAEPELVADQPTSRRRR